MVVMGVFLVGCCCDVELDSEAGYDLWAGPNGKRDRYTVKRVSRVLFLENTILLYYTHTPDLTEHMLQARGLRRKA